MGKSTGSRLHDPTRTVDPTTFRNFLSPELDVQMYRAVRRSEEQRGSPLHRADVGVGVRVRRGA